MIKADAIAVLGCRVKLDGTPTRALQRRIRLAARAYHRGVAPLIIASGGKRWGPHIEALVMKEQLRSAGVPEQAVLTELCSLSTSDNAFYCAQIMSRRQLSRALIATCAWHLPRAIRRFRRCGVEGLAPPPSWIEPAPDPPPRLRLGIEQLWKVLDTLVELWAQPFVRASR